MNTNKIGTEVKRGPGNPNWIKGRRPPRRILSPTEEQSLQNMVDKEASEKIESEHFYPSEKSTVVGKSEQVQRIEKTLANGQPDSHNRWDKAKLDKRAGELKSWLVKNMVPSGHVGLRMSRNGVQSMEFQKAKNFMAQKEMSPEFQKVASEYKNIMRNLGRPDQANLENIRPSEL